MGQARMRGSKETRVANAVEREDNFRKMKLAIADCIFDSDQRHFLDFHFGNFTPFAKQFTEQMCILGFLSPGSGYAFARRIGSLKGELRSTYEQIVQAVCELVIARKFIDSYPLKNGFKLKWEPTGKTKSNPEFMIEGPDWRLLVEVKCPSLFDYDSKNRSASQQVPARLPGMKEIMTAIGGGIEPALPLDNKVKDFLVSAEKKFSSFEEIAIPTYGLLVICWGERMFEAISPLSNEACGLLKTRSYFEENGNKIRFPHVSGVLVTQHQYFIQRMLAGFLPSHQRSCLDYGEYWAYNTPPNPVISSNEFALRALPREFVEKLQAVNAGESLDPIAGIMDTVWWLHR